MISIIALEREYGSGAAYIAKTLANRLGWSLWDHEITCEIARRLKCDIESVEKREERLDPAFYRLAKIFMRGSYEDSFTGSGLELLDAEHLSRLFERVVNDVAGKGRCILVGRGAPWFLRERVEAFRVFIYAPYEDKIGRLLAQGKSQAEAEELVERVDRERAAFIKKYYGKVWPQRDLYHVMVNSASGEDLAVEIILNAMELVQKRPAVRMPA